MVQALLPSLETAVHSQLWHFNYLRVSGYLNPLLPVSFSGGENNEIRFK